MISAPNIQRPSKRSMCACVGILAAITWTLWLGVVSVFAQSAPNGLLVPGNAAVSVFSGAIGPAQVAPGVNPLGFTFINLNGPSLRVADLQNMRAPPSAQLVKVPKPFTILAAQIGQVFAVALDNAVPPNIYAAATSAYGLHIARPGNDGLLTHARIGAPNTTFMPGMWGQAAPGGGPGSIWKIDGVTGAVSLFANVQLNGIANSGPALGGLVFDPDSNSFFVADRETGFIHRFSIAGAEIGRYDHGVQGRTAQGLPAVAFDPAKRLNITSAEFNATQPATWNYAAPERRVFGLAVRNGRLYYAVAESLQIWSVAIGPQDLTDPVLELSAPPGSGPSEISKITFDDQGRMLLAERPDPTGAEDFRALTQEGAGRLLRYAIAAIYPGLPRTWQAVPDDYAIGFPGSMTNGNGGAALGFDYDRTGRIDRGSCGGFLWATGEQLRRSADVPIAERLSQSGPANVDGLQGDYIWTIRPNNTPPLRSYFIDYDDRFDDDAARGHLGDIAIWRICGPALRGGWMLPSWFAWVEDGGSIPLPPVLSCPVDQQKPGFQCCPKGTSPGANGQCKPWCPNGKMDSKSQNLCGLGFDAATDDPNNPAQIKCIGGAIPSPGKGILGCADHSPVLNPAVCQAGWAKQNAPNIGNICQPTKAQMQCPPGQQVSSVDNKCHALCLGGTAWPSKQCCAVGSAVTPTGQCCPLGATVDPKTGTCSKLISVCPKDSKPNPKTGVCEPPGKACPPGSTPDPKTGACARLTTPCLPGLSPDSVSGECKKAPPKLSCAPSQQSSDGQCCKAGWSPNNAIGGCCPPGQASGPGGACKITACFAPNKQVSGKCCSPSDLKPGGSCANTLCGIGNAPTGSNNACCGADQIYTGKNGVQTCCPSPLVDGQCMPAKGTPVQPQCSPGSTDPNCCAAGYKWAGASCCLASQLTSKGQCCPTGQKPSGADQAQCQPDLKTGIPPYNPGNPGSSTTIGKCCMTGLIPIASGICCAPNQVTSAGVCCPAGQAPDPKNRRVCVPVQTCGLRETLVNGACCSNSNLYTDASGRSQCCGQLVDPLTNVCPGPAVGDLPQCFAGYTRTSDGSCCANNLVTRDGRCSVPGKPSQLVPVVPVPPSVRVPREMVPPAQSPRPPRSPSQPPRPPAPPQVRPGLPPPAVRPLPNQLRPMPMFRPPVRPVLPQQRCTFINGREVCR
jgi:hypothetical protein